MTARNQLLESPPYAVEQALKRLGSNLRTARLRRNLTVEDITGRIGTGRRAVMDAEKGKVSTAAAVYLGLLWAYDLMTPLDDVANPATDEQGLTLASSRDRTRARKGSGLSNDF